MSPTAKSIAINGVWGGDAVDNVQAVTFAGLLGRV